VIEETQAGISNAKRRSRGSLAAGAAALAKVMKFDHVWVRVHVLRARRANWPRSDSRGLAANSDRGPRGSLPAHSRASGPDTPGATVDMYYELANPSGRLRPGNG